MGTWRVSPFLDLGIVSTPALKSTSRQRRPRNSPRRKPVWSSTVTRFRSLAPGEPSSAGPLLHRRGSGRARWAREASSAWLPDWSWSSRPGSRCCRRVLGRRIHDWRWRGDGFLGASLSSVGGGVFWRSTRSCPARQGHLIERAALEPSGPRITVALVVLVGPFLALHAGEVLADHVGRGSWWLMRRVGQGRHSSAFSLIAGHGLGADLLPV